MFKDLQYEQDQFIASLDLPTYHNFSSYQFMDIIDALSFRLMVLDHIKKTRQMDGTLSRKESQFSFGA